MSDLKLLCGFITSKENIIPSAITFKVCTVHKPDGTRGIGYKKKTLGTYETVFIYMYIQLCSYEKPTTQFPTDPLQIAHIKLVQYSFRLQQTCSFTYVLNVIKTALN